ncbi:MAG: hypothetical protein R3286_16730, partial [Gammaproteobacteria bacterium]|nr:hypothetical protein [Gammaproteobacteria bacterium]
AQAAALALLQNTDLGAEEIVRKALMISGNGDVIEPEHDALAIGSGGSYALAAARAMLENTDLDARSIVEKALTIAGDICVYTNAELTLEALDGRPG